MLAAIKVKMRGIPLKPGFHMIVPIAPVVSKNYKAIRTADIYIYLLIGSFHMIASIALKTRHAGSSAMSLGETIEFLLVFRKKAKHNHGF